MQMAKSYIRGILKILDLKCLPTLTKETIQVTNFCVAVFWQVLLPSAHSFGLSLCCYTFYFFKIVGHIV